ncbi:MAG: acyl-CoA thioesterase [Pirellulales bacterium]|nr:acyl-CoA thioesterase [Pirellulales bacterium]
MACEFRWQHRVEFAETDMAGIVHFSNYFRYMEMAEHAFLRSLGLSVHADNGGRAVSWPRVRAECSFQSPLTFEDVVEVRLLVREKTSRTITYEFQLAKDGGGPVARGSTTVVCVSIEPQSKRMKALPIPSWIDEKIEVAPDALFASRQESAAGSGPSRNNQSA